MSNSTQTAVADSQRPRRHKAASRVITTKRNKRVAVRLWDWSVWCRQVIRGVQRFSHEQQGWEVIADIGPLSSVTTSKRSAHTQTLPLDGAIVGVMNDIRAYRRILHDDSPKLVAVSAHIPRQLSAITSVRVNETKVADAIGRHLLSGGFRHFAYFGGGRPGGRNYRAEAMRAFAQTNDCDFFDDAVFQGPPTFPTVKRWLKRLAMPTAIVCWNMNTARTIVTACLREGIRIPEQAAVVGWDDDVVLAESSKPTITAAVMPAERLGYEAAKLLNQLMAGHDAASPLLIDPPPALLHVRESSDVSSLQDRDVWLALQYIREHGSEALKVSHLVKALRISRRKLEIQFKKVTGNTLHDAILNVRIEQAKQFLLETDWPLDRVASRAGLATRQTLYNVFVRREQMTPATYRKRFGAVS